VTAQNSDAQENLGGALARLEMEIVRVLAPNPIVSDDLQTDLGIPKFAAQILLERAAKLLNSGVTEPFPTSPCILQLGEMHTRGFLPLTISVLRSA
jgi:hypothetical protein